MISENLAVIRAGINKAARKNKRRPDEIKIVCVTKGRSAEEIEEAIAAGISDIGENRVQETIAKHRALQLTTYDLQLKWHLVGHLQTNKAKDAVAIFSLIHSVDSLKLAREIDKQAARINKIQDILIEVNTSGEKSKFGIRPEETPGLAEEIVGLKNIRLQGLMTMAPIVKDQEHARPYFRKLRELGDEINNFLGTRDQGPGASKGGPSTILSMGMSQDYEVAVEEGATMVRIGNAIFER